MDNEEKYKRNMECLDGWMQNRENGKWIAEFLRSCRVSQVGVYGYGILGKHLVWELLDKDFPVRWVMDRSAWGNKLFAEISRPEDAPYLDAVDMVVITSFESLEEMERLIFGTVEAETIISIEELFRSIESWNGCSV